MKLATEAAAGLSLLLLAPVSVAQVTTRVSVSSANVQGNGASYAGGLSDDGHDLAFASYASNLVPNDTNGTSDVFVRDLWNGTTTLVSQSSAGVQGAGSSSGGVISGDGRYVVFYSSANNLVPGDTNNQMDIFVRDLQLSTTVRASVDSAGAEANGMSDFHNISRDGRVVTFRSFATNLAPGVPFGWGQLYAHDLQTGTTELLSQSTAGVIGNNHSDIPIPSRDGSKVLLVSNASNLVPGDTNSNTDLFLRDRLAGTTTRVSLTNSGGQAAGASTWGVFNDDATLVAFESWAPNLVAGDTNGEYDVFLRDLVNGTTTRVSLDSAGGQGNHGAFGPFLSPDGRFVAFSSWSDNLVAGDTNGWLDGFVRDLQTGITMRVSVSTAGAQGDQSTYANGITADGRLVMMSGEATDLVSGDTNGAYDVFLRDRDATGFTSLCDPGLAGVIGCPCSNPPGASGRGCDNSAATGGAVLSASGVAYLGADSLVFTTSGEKPTATSVLLQGTTLVAAGAVYGQGVRCLGGTLKRLYTKAASSGSITAPDFGAGDPTVSARSAAKGNPIGAGQSRWYLVFYRDPTVLGGCPSGSTFNATQSGRIDWLP